MVETGGTDGGEKVESTESSPTNRAQYQPNHRPSRIIFEISVMEANEMTIEVTGTDEMPIQVMEAMEANEMTIEVTGTNEMPVQDEQHSLSIGS
ncbi:hypothetical protein DVH24_005355 [Malus domestica]|uniref:Uncharacterized protein n=1 Tax=Malus domestica TaxID=3750 RepID=A0A498KPE5_MALDO|nr:hypothetical protein DVH24_005355 [Malus domestica]